MTNPFGLQRSSKTLLFNVPVIWWDYGCIVTFSAACISNHPTRMNRISSINVEIQPSNKNVIMVTPDHLHFELTEIRLLSNSMLKHFLQLEGMISQQTMRFHICHWSNHLVLIPPKISQLTLLGQCDNAFTCHWLHERHTCVSEWLPVLTVFFHSGFLLCWSHSHRFRSLRSTQNEIPRVMVSWKG